MCIESTKHYHHFLAAGHVCPVLRAEALVCPLLRVNQELSNGHSTRTPLQNTAALGKRHHLLHTRTVLKLL